MVYYKNFLEVDKATETEFYRICTDLVKHGKSIIEYAGTDRWCEVARKIGIQGKPLIHHEPPLLFPVARTRNNKYFNIGLVQIPNDVKVREVSIGAKSLFIFKRI